MRIPIFLFSLLLVFAACKTSQKQSATEPVAKTELSDMPLTNTKWYLAELNGLPIDREDHIPYLVFTDSSRVGGHGGCNSLGGPYEVNDNNRLTFGPMYRTEMYCTGRMEVEDALLEVLEKTDSYVITGNELQLLRAKMAPLAKFKSR